MRMPMALAALLFVLAAGCGATVVEVTGKVLQNGEPFKPMNAEDLQVVFTPHDKQGAMCVAAVRKDGTFKMMGPTGGNIPVGTYRVELLQAYSKNLKGEFEGEKSPLTFTATNEKSVRKLVIDVGKRTVTDE